MRFDGFTKSSFFSVCLSRSILFQLVIKFIFLPFCKRKYLSFTYSYIYKGFLPDNQHTTNDQILNFRHCTRSDDDDALSSRYFQIRAYIPFDEHEIYSIFIELNCLIFSIYSLKNSTQIMWIRYNNKNSK